MDKTVEILIVAVIAVIAATIIVVLLTGQTDSFGDFLTGSSEDAECRMLQTQYESTDPDNQEARNQLESDANALEDYECDTAEWDTPTEDSSDGSGGSGTSGGESGTSGGESGTPGGGSGSVTIQ